MRNLIIAAFIAACVTFQGRVDAKVMSSPKSQSIGQLTSKISPELADRIIKKAASNSEYTYLGLTTQYLLGKMYIEKVDDGLYKAVIQNVDGGVSIISILDDF